MTNKLELYSVIDTVREIYLSDNALKTLLDFERVLDFIDLYVFEHWDEGEIVRGPITSRYFIECTFMWPAKLMPDPKGAKRLLGYNAKIKMWEGTLLTPKKQLTSIPNIVGNESQSSRRSAKYQVIERKVWFVNIKLPKSLLHDIERGYVEMSGETINLDDIQQAEQEDLEQKSHEEQDIEDVFA